MDDERWLPVPGYEGFYDVSSLGRVRSLPRTKTKGGILKPGRKGIGYQLVVLSRGQLPQVSTSVHVIVAAAFLGPCPPGMEVRHKNGDPADNQVSNLTYGTHAENMQDQILHGMNHNLNKTHCPAGHEYTEENTKRIAARPNGRFCKECQRIWNREYMRRKRAAQRAAASAA